MNHIKKIIPYFLMFPAIVIGMLAMISYGVLQVFGFKTY